MTEPSQEHVPWKSHENSLRYYRKVPQDMQAMFYKFRHDHPLKKTQVEGTPWEYILSGSRASQPLMLLPGGLGSAESAWRTITRLDERKYYLLCPSYPTQISTMSGLAHGIADILRQEGIQSTYLMARAYGSMLAQVFVHQHAEQVDKLVLTEAYPPDSSRIRTVEPILRIYRYAPMFVVRNLLRAQMIGRLPAIPSPELLLIAAQVRETIDQQLTRQGAMNIYLRMAEFDKQEFTYTDLEGWPGKALFILAEDDPTNTEDLRNSLVALYPGVTLRTIKGNSQTATPEEAAETVRLMEAFFEGKDSTYVEETG
jgi:pimeloyl-ACP methyl ester carboxylesterase